MPGDDGGGGVGTTGVGGGEKPGGHGPFIPVVGQNEVEGVGIVGACADGVGAGFLGLGGIGRPLPVKIGRAHV